MGRDPVSRVPKDGSWVEYDWTLSRILTTDDRGQELAGTLTFKIVGTEVVDQTTYRWCEGTFIYNEDGTKPHPVILKMLLNAAALKAIFAGTDRELEPQ